jgi:hypothetical protein
MAIGPTAFAGPQSFLSQPDQLQNGKQTAAGLVQEASRYTVCNIAVLDPSGQPPAEACQPL